jgi:hypothetical protein
MDADPDRPEVNPFNLAVFGCQAFFDQHPCAFEYFALIGCANWFGGCISNFHLDRARRSFLAAIEQCHVAKAGFRRHSQTSPRTHSNF